MKLGEALARRSDLHTKLGTYQARVQAVASVPEDESPDEWPEDIIDEMENTAEQLRDLIIQINITNSLSHVEFDGIDYTVTELLAERDVLRQLAGVYNQLSILTGYNPYRVSRSEIKYIQTIKPSDIRGRQQEINERLHNLDIALQQSNWQIDVIE